jgi:hypothetical protein
MRPFAHTTSWLLSLALNCLAVLHLVAALPLLKALLAHCLTGGLAFAIQTENSPLKTLVKATPAAWGVGINTVNQLLL